MHRDFAGIAIYVSEIIGQPQWWANVKRVQLELTNGPV